MTIGRFVSIIKIFAILRIAEFIFAITAMTLLAYLLPGEYACDSAISECLRGFESLKATVMVFAGFALYYVVGTYYLLLSLIVFVAYEFIFRLGPKNISFLNSVPYAFHALPILLGYFGGEVSQNGLFWQAWIGIIVFNFITPRLLLGDFTKDNGKGQPMLGT